MRKIKAWFNKYDWSTYIAILAFIAALATVFGMSYLFYRWIFWGTLF